MFDTYLHCCTGANIGLKNQLGEAPIAHILPQAGQTTHYNYHNNFNN
jgi:hypothetical protein